AGDRHDRRTALVDRAQRVLDTHPLSQDVGRIVDLAAPRAREVALKQGLEHQDQRIALIPLQLLLEDVARDPETLYEWNAHSFSLFRKKVPDAILLGEGRLTRFLL